MSEFCDSLESYISPVLLSRNILLAHCYELHGGRVEACLYKTKEVKILVYYSDRDGEVNALIGSNSANESDIYSSDWVFVRSLISSLTQRSVKELLDGIPKNHLSLDAQVNEIAQLICENFDEILVNFQKREKLS